MMLFPVLISKNYTHYSIVLLTDVYSATTPVASKPQTSKKAPAPQASLSPAPQPLPEQGTTQRNPVNIEDDDSNEEDKDGMDEDVDASYGKLVTEVMSQEPQEKQKTPQSRNQAQSGFLFTHESPTQQSSGHMVNTHANLDMLAQERASRQPNIVGFDDSGPRNQGSRRQKKPFSSGIHNQPFGEASSPVVDPFSVQESLPTFFETSGLDKPKEALDFDAPRVPARINTVVSLLSTTSRDNAALKPTSTSGQLRETVMAVEVSAARGTSLTGSESLAKSVTLDLEGTKPQLIKKPTGNTFLNERQSSGELQAQSEFLDEDLSQQLSKKHGDFDGKLHRNTDVTKPPAPLVKDKASIDSGIPRGPNPVDPIQPAPREHTQALSDQSVSQVRPHNDQPQHIDKTSKTSGIKASMLAAEHSQAKVQLQVHQTTLPANDRKRPPVEVAGEAAKRFKADTHGRTQPIQPAAAKDSVFRRLSQVKDNGSPMPYRGVTSQERALVPQTRQESIPAASTPPPFASYRPTDESLTRPTALTRNKAARAKSLLEEVRAPHGDSPLQVSRPITHAGFDEDTQITAEHPQTPRLHRDLTKHASPVSFGSPPRRVPPVQNSVGLMEALLSKAAHQTDASGTGQDNGKEIPGSEEPMEEEDPDKTLVNEDSDDGDDSDDDGSGSRNSSDTDGDDVAKSALSRWRDALESHQGDVYDQLVRIAHRLTSHLKDHETAIKDINTDYSSDGMRLIQRLVRDNEAKLEQYRTKQSKIQGASVLGCDQVRGSLYKDMKDVKASHERFVKTLQKQVNAIGRLDQIMQTYQA